jgi:hypothetical protein
MNIGIKYFLFFTFLFYKSTLVFSQEKQISFLDQAIHYDKKDGLQTMEIYNSFSDSKGYIWFGSDKGAIRYNGIKFETFNVRDGLPSNDIFSFCEDRFGRIWIESYVNKLCFYKDGVFHTEANTPWLKLDFEHSRPIEITNTPQKDVIISFLGTYDKYVEIIDTLKKVIVVPNKVKNYIDTITDNNYKIRPYHKFYLKKNIDNTYLLFLPNIDINFLGDKVIDIKLQKNNRILLGNVGFVKNYQNGDIYSIVKKTTIASTTLIKNIIPEAYNSYYINSNYLFLSTIYKGIVYNYAENTIKEEIDNINISYINEDYQGNIWISTKGDGIFKLNRNANNINIFKTKKMTNTIILKNEDDICFVDKNMQTYTISKSNKIIPTSFISNYKFEMCDYKTMQDTFFYKKLQRYRIIYELNNKIAFNKRALWQEANTLYKEIELIRNYILMEKLRHGVVFTYIEEIEEDIDIEKIMIPPLLLQPIIENAILHGILPSTLQDKYLKFSITELNDEVTITIEDNGMGINNKKQQTSHKSVALSNIETRIDYLNKLYNIDITINTQELNNNYAEKGTICTLVVK